MEKGRKRYSCARSVALNDDHCVIKLLCFLLLGLTSHSSSVKQCFMNLVTFLPLKCVLDSYQLISLRHEQKTRFLVRNVKYQTRIVKGGKLQCLEPGDDRFKDDGGVEN